MSAAEPSLRGRSLIGSTVSKDEGERFRGIDPVTAEPLEPAYVSASPGEVRAAVRLAAEAAPVLRSASAEQRAGLLREIAKRLEDRVDLLVDRATQETALAEGRIRGETARTCGQLRLFANLVDEGSWVDARIDHADPARTPTAKPDVRSMLRGRGPVAVFGASNFPLAFSVAGGDAASALAGGNPVLVKAHPAHPGTSEIVGQLVVDAVHEVGLPAGTFSLLFDAAHEVGRALVTADEVAAVGFTGSRKGGRALMDLAAARVCPIPVFAEMGSVNPVFLLAGAMAARTEAIASGLAASISLGVGQFCTNPGLVFVLAEDADRFTTALRRAFQGLSPGTMLTPTIARAYRDGADRLAQSPGVRSIASTVDQKSTACAADGRVFETDTDRFLEDASLAEEIFGPASLVIRCANPEAMLEAACRLEGQLTASIHAESSDADLLRRLAETLEARAGRLIVNGFPTGVEVCPAMVHGGPYPATSDGGSTSVGTRAIARFCRAVAYQDWPDALLPPELQESNPRRIHRLVDGALRLPSA